MRSKPHMDEVPVVPPESSEEPERYQRGTTLKEESTIDFRLISNQRVSMNFLIDGTAHNRCESTQRRLHMRLVRHVRGKSWPLI